MRIPKGFAGVSPYLFVADASDYIRFLQDAFGAAELGRSLTPDGRIANAQVQLSGTTLMISEASDGFPPSRSALYLYVDDADATTDRAVQAGAELIMEPSDMPYGDRQSGVRDPAGTIWWISQRLTDEPYF
ncbi:VOC family protein [Brevundimonas intermedia]|uniref:VOC family protein n=1 Tax=Brevundimonas intermedia TaxID=74315 RepID=A0A4Y9S094_9CAUL|nr:VOC family protein [Brevundimonas intermedia]TFW12958.1 VOC family protein [Brevundimonas intermedia]